MSTYEEFMVILTIGLLIVAILNLKNKHHTDTIFRPLHGAPVFLP